MDPIKLDRIKSAQKSLAHTRCDTYEGKTFDYELWACLEGRLDPADEPISALARGCGTDSDDCLARIRSHLKCTHGDRLQIIVTDNDPPQVSDVPIVLTVSDSDRFVPSG